MLPNKINKIILNHSRYKSLQYFKSFYITINKSHNNNNNSQEPIQSITSNQLNQLDTTIQKQKSRSKSNQASRISIELQCKEKLFEIIRVNNRKRFDLEMYMDLYNGYIKVKDFESALKCLKQSQLISVACCEDILEVALDYGEFNVVDQVIQIMIANGLEPNQLFQERYFNEKSNLQKSIRLLQLIDQYIALDFKPIYTIVKCALLNDKVSVVKKLIENGYCINLESQLLIKIHNKLLEEVESEKSLEYLKLVINYKISDKEFMKTLVKDTLNRGQLDYKLALFEMVLDIGLKKDQSNCNYILGIFIKANKSFVREYFASLFKIEDYSRVIKCFDKLLNSPESFKSNLKYLSTNLIELKIIMDSYLAQSKDRSCLKKACYLYDMVNSCGIQVHHGFVISYLKVLNLSIKNRYTPASRFNLSKITQDYIQVSKLSPAQLKNFKIKSSKLISDQSNPSLSERQKKN